MKDCFCNKNGIVQCMHSLNTGSRQNNLMLLLLFVFYPFLFRYYIGIMPPCIFWYKPSPLAKKLEKFIHPLMNCACVYIIHKITISHQHNIVLCTLWWLYHIWFYIYLCKMCLPIVYFTCSLPPRYLPNPSYSFALPIKWSEWLAYSISSVSIQFGFVFLSNVLLVFSPQMEPHIFTTCFQNQENHRQRVRSSILPSTTRYHKRLTCIFKWYLSQIHTHI